MDILHEVSSVWHSETGILRPAYRFSFFLSFFLLLSTQFRELVTLRKKLAQKHVSSKIFLASLLNTSGTGVFSRHFLATVGMRKYWQKENGK